MLVPVSMLLALELLGLPAGGLIASLEVVESARGPVVLSVDSVPNALVAVLVPFSLPPQLLSAKPPSSNAARGRREEVLLPAYTVATRFCPLVQGFAAGSSEAGDPRGMITYKA